MAIAACCKIWPLAKFPVSAAKSASSILPFEAERFIAILSRFAIVLVSLFDTAPSLPLSVDTVAIAVSKADIAVCALAAV